jgi:DNA replication protein DnaC
MARRTFKVIDVAEILVHWHAGRSLSEIAESLGVDRKTVRKYVAPFLQVLCHDEIARRESQAIARRIRRAHFEQQLTLEEFDYTASPKLPAA